MDFLNILESMKDFLWDNFLIYVLLLVGILFTVRLGFPQIMSLKEIFTQPFKGMFDKDSDGVSSFQALATSIAGQVGTGNIGGVATAIMAGGPGAIFWMWVSGILGMSTIFGEAVLAQVYREETEDGYVGGPAYYISKGLKNKKLGRILAAIFAVLIILALGLIGSMVQANSMSVALETGFGFNPMIVGIVVAIAAALIFVGGITELRLLQKY